MNGVRRLSREALNVKGGAVESSSCSIRGGEDRQSQREFSRPL